MHAGKKWFRYSLEEMKKKKKIRTKRCRSRQGMNESTSERRVKGRTQYIYSLAEAALKRGKNKFRINDEWRVVEGDDRDKEWQKDPVRRWEMDEAARKRGKVTIKMEVYWGGKEWKKWSLTSETKFQLLDNPLSQFSPCLSSTSDVKFWVFSSSRLSETFFRRFR